MRLETFNYFTYYKWADSYDYTLCSKNSRSINQTIVESAHQTAGVHMADHQLYGTIYTDHQRCSFLLSPRPPTRQHTPCMPAPTMWLLNPTISVCLSVRLEISSKFSPCSTRTSYPVKPTNSGTPQIISSTATTASSTPMSSLGPWQWLVHRGAHCSLPAACLEPPSMAYGLYGHRQPVEGSPEHSINARRYHVSCLIPHVSCLMSHVSCLMSQVSGM